MKRRQTLLARIDRALWHEDDAALEGWLKAMTLGGCFFAVVWVGFEVLR